MKRSILTLISVAIVSIALTLQADEITPVVMPFGPQSIEPVEAVPVQAASTQQRVGNSGKLWRGYDDSSTVCGTTTPRAIDVRRGNAVSGSVGHADIPVTRRGRLRLGCPVRNTLRGIATPRKKERLIRMNGRR